MSTTKNVWQLADVEEEEFAAAASLFANQTQQKSVCSPPLTIPDGDNDDSSDVDNEEDWQTDVPCQNLPSAAEDNRRKNRFLNRLAEVLARDKSAYSRQKQSKAKHVAAAAWIEPDGHDAVTILLAKNEGLDNRDLTMLKRLQKWLQTVSGTGRVPAIDRDIIWIGREEKEGLLEYSRCRLQFYISQICQYKMDVTVADVSPSDLLQCLHQMCCTFGNSPTISALEKIVNLAYELRSSYDCRHLKPLFGAKVVNAVLMLGRIREAYECFVTTAFSFPGFKHITLEPVQPPFQGPFKRTKFQEHVQRLTKDAGRELPRNSKSPSRLHVHAEMQVLCCLESDPKWRKNAHSYIGASKKPCFLCCELLRNYKRFSVNGFRAQAFYARSSHGKVYPLWTLPSIPAMAEANVGSSLAAALKEVYSHVRKSISECSAVLRPAMPESSAGMSRSVASIDRAQDQLKRPYLDKERIKTSHAPENVEDDSDIFGPKLKEVRVIRLPVDGSEPETVLIPLHSVHPESTRRIPEPNPFVPDFRKYWGGFHSDRKLKEYVLDEYPNDFKFGYWIYRNENTELLLENKWVKDVLGISHIDSSRRFYYGDVFVMRFVQRQVSEVIAQNTTEATNSEVIASVKAELCGDWNAEILETQFRGDIDFEAFRLKMEADKEILLQRMTPVERRIFEREPQWLELLAIQACDDDAVVSSEVVPSDVPDMVCILEKRKVKASDSYGWTGFDSSQL